MEEMDFLMSDAADHQYDLDPLSEDYLKQQEKLKEETNRMYQEEVIMGDQTSCIMAQFGLLWLKLLSFGRNRVMLCETNPQLYSQPGVVLKICPLNENVEDNDKFDKKVHLLQKFSDLGVTRLLRAMKFPDLGLAAIVTEFCPGGTLARVLESPGISDQFQQSRIAFRLIETVTGIHKRNIVHRNICPSNILIDSDGLPVLAGFGSAFWHGPDEYLIRGVPALQPYLAPEIAKKPFKFHDSYKADIFSLGMVLCRVVFPELFHQSARKMHKKLSTLSHPHDSLQALFQELLPHMITKDPKERYDSRDVQDFFFIHYTRICRIKQTLNASRGIPPLFDHIQVEGFNCDKPPQREDQQVKGGVNSSSSSSFVFSYQSSPPDEKRSAP